MLEKLVIVFMLLLYMLSDKTSMGDKFWIALLITPTLVALVTYIITSTVFYKLYKRMGYKLALLAWIPYVREGVLVLLTDLDNTNSINILGKRFNRNLVKFFPLLYLLVFIPMIGTILVVLTKLFIFGSVCRDLYCKVERLSQKDVKIIGYFSGIFPVVLIAKIWQYLYSWRELEKNRLNKEG